MEYLEKFNYNKRVLFLPSFCTTAARPEHELDP